MSNLYDLLNRKQAYTRHKENWQEAQKQQKAFCYQTIEQALTEVGNSPEAFMRYLDMQAHFDLYSPRNVLLIQAQAPQATRLADAAGWEAQGTVVKRSAFRQPIYILEPGRQYERQDGSMGQYYNPKKMYDISQTLAEVTPEKEQPITDRLLLKALITDSPVQIETIETKEGQAKAQFDHQTMRLSVQKGLTPDELFQAVCLELCKVNILRYGETPSDLEGIATSAAYLVCKQVGKTPEPISSTVHARLFQDKDGNGIAKELTTIRDSAGTMMDQIAFNLSRFNDKNKSMAR